MKRTLSAVALATVSTFAMDQYAPVAPNTIDAGLSYQYISVTGNYDVDGTKQDVPSGYSPAINAPGLRLKYGIMPGLDAELALNYMMYNKDAGDVSGLNRPEIGVKYIHPEIGAGGYLNIVLPVGSKDIVGDAPTTTIEVGGMYVKSFGQIGVNAALGYDFMLENDDKVKQDEISALLQGQFNVNEQIGPYLAAEFTKTLEAQYDGEGIPDTDGYLLTIVPGIKSKPVENVSAELYVPITVLGKNAIAAWAIGANVSYSIGL